MNASTLARTAYASKSSPARSALANELDALSRITYQLGNVTRTKNYAEFVAALHQNRQLWTILAADVADTNNPLPSDLRARIFYLAEFTLHHTSAILAGRTNAATLVDINTAIIRGLRQQGGTQ